MYERHGSGTNAGFLVRKSRHTTRRVIEKILPVVLVLKGCNMRVTAFSRTTEERAPEGTVYGQMRRLPHAAITLRHNGSIYMAASSCSLHARVRKTGFGLQNSASTDRETTLSLRDTCAGCSAPGNSCWIRIWPFGCHFQFNSTRETTVLYFCRGRWTR